MSVDYMKKLLGAIIGAAIGVPSIAIGFYVTYQLVTAIGN
jgi:hypothetical protein